MKYIAKKKQKAFVGLGNRNPRCRTIRIRRTKHVELTSVAKPQGVTSFSLLEPEPEQEPHQNVPTSEICTMNAKGVGAASVFLSGSA
jgi:hypothetical protein